MNINAISVQIPINKPTSSDIINKKYLIASIKVFNLVI